MRLVRIVRRARSEIETGGLMDCASASRDERQADGGPTCVCHAIQRACAAMCPTDKDCSQAAADVRDVMAEAVGTRWLCGWQDDSNREATIMAFDRATALAEVRQ